MFSLCQFTWGGGGGVTPLSGPMSLPGECLPPSPVNVPVQSPVTGPARAGCPSEDKVTPWQDRGTHQTEYRVATL